MRLFGRGRPGGKRSGGHRVGGKKATADVRHMEAFVASRRGVEGFVEPQTAVTETTIVLVAADGEWTRRRVDSPQAAFDLGKTLAIPVYDVAATGYPARMREWTARRKAAGQTGVPRSEPSPDIE